MNVHTTDNGESGNSAVKQNLVDSNQQTIAVLNYAIGNHAYGLMVQNQSQFIEGSPNPDNQTINVKGDTSKSFSENGIAYGDRTDGGDAIWTLAILTGVDIQKNKVLSLSGIDTGSSTSLWSAVVSGDGGIEYEGKGTLDIGTAITKWLDGSLYDDSNTYTGSTTVKGLTLYLKKDKSLGNTSLLSIGSDATVNVGTDSEDVGQLDLSDGTLNLNDKTFNVGNAGAVISSDGQLKGSTANLIVDGDLTVKSENTEFTGSTVSARNITVSSVKAFGDETVSTAKEKYVFDGAEGEQGNEISANQIVLKKNSDGNAAHVEYNPDVISLLLPL